MPPIKAVRTILLSADGTRAVSPMTAVTMVRLTKHGLGHWKWQVYWIDPAQGFAGRILVKHLAGHGTAHFRSSAMFSAIEYAVRLCPPIKEQP